MLHPFPKEADSLPSPEQFTYPFCYKAHPLCQIAAREVIEHCYSVPEMHPAEGKMFGVLVVEKEGRRYYLRAFSGIYNGSYHHDGFVPPVCDLQSGYFREEEQRIVALTERIKQSSDEDEKAELKVLRKEKSGALQMWTFRQFRMLNANKETKDLLEIFQDVKSPFPEEEYIAYKTGRTPVKPQASIGVPPGGTGECCAPKLLQYAYLHDLKPLCMAEFWVGPSKQNDMRVEGNFYPSCQHKCFPLLTYMMQGLDVEENPLFKRGREKLKKVRFVYEDDHLIVVYKPSGLLSVPNRDLKEQSLSAYLLSLNPEYRLVHRLDMDTSGLLLVAKNADVCRDLQRQFYMREVKKKYVAILEDEASGKAAEAKVGEFSEAAKGEVSEAKKGNFSEVAKGVHASPLPLSGYISLPLSRNPFDSPRQVVSHEYGKPSVTRYVMKGTNRVELYPETGRTHQLRIHCAHPDGLGRPIKGDILYGTPSDRLYLHAERIEFRHPATGEWMTFEDKEI